MSLLTVGIVRPNLFMSSDVGTFARIIIISFFVVGVIHIVDRVRDAFDRYTYDDADIHESIFDETELPTRQFSRYTLTGMLLIGIFISLGAGLAIGYLFDMRSLTVSYLFAPSLTTDILVFPPIFVLIVDTVHGFILKAEA